MQAIELETTIVHGEIHARLPQGINAKKAKLIVMYEEETSAGANSAAEILNLLDDISARRDWPVKNRQEIDRDLDAERASWD